MRCPQKFSIDDVLVIAKANARGRLPDGRLVALRPYTIAKFSRRLALAWGVLIGRYDALNWPGE